jgi:hypothetical protein
MEANKETARRALQTLEDSQIPNNYIYDEFEAPTPAPAHRVALLPGFGDEKDSTHSKEESDNEDILPLIEGSDDDGIVVQTTEADKDKENSTAQPEEFFTSSFDCSLHRDPFASSPPPTLSIHSSVPRDTPFSPLASAEDRTRIDNWNRHIIDDLYRPGGHSLRRGTLLSNTIFRNSSAILRQKYASIAPLNKRTCMPIKPSYPQFSRHSGIGKVWRYPPGSKGFKRECYAQWVNFQWRPREERVYRPMGVGRGWQSWLSKARLFGEYNCRVVKYSPSKLRHEVPRVEVRNRRGAIAF